MRRAQPAGKVTIVAVRMLLVGGDGPLLAIARRLQCSACRVRAAPVYLLAGRTRNFLGGPFPDWAIELVPGPRVDVPSGDGR
jgi:hypothetical protein